MINKISLQFACMSFTSFLFIFLVLTSLAFYHIYDNALTPKYIITIYFY